MPTPKLISTSGKFITYKSINKLEIQRIHAIPCDLHFRLQAVAARKGCSVHQLILESLEQAVQDAELVRPQRRSNLEPPIVPSTGRKIDLTNEQIYDIIEFP
jgi:hypothetical protein